MSEHSPAGWRSVADVDPGWLSLPAGVVAAALVLAYAPVPADMATMLAITAFSVSLWVGTPVAPWFTGLVAIGLVGVAFSTDLALSGFRSPATWLIVLGILLGEATRESGLAALVERAAVGLMPDCVAGDALATYRYLLVVLSAAALAFAVLVPSALVRVLVLGPILYSLGADLFDERRARLGLFLGPVFVTYYGASGILTAALPNIVISGLVEANAGVGVGWFEWGLWMGPVMGVGRTLAVVAVAYLLYRPRERSSVDATAVGDRTAPDGSDDSPVADTAAESSLAVGQDQRRMLAFLFVGVAIWATDVVHGLHPLYGALVVALLAFAPRVGVVDPGRVGEADVSIVFFVGAIFAIAEGLRRTAFTDLAAGSVLSALPEGAGLGVVLVFVAVVALLLTFVMEGLAVASVLTPVLVSFASSAGVPVEPVAMVEAVALNTYFFPYQSAVLVAIVGLDVVDTVELVKMATVCSLVTLTVLLPLQILVFVVAF